MQYKLFLIYRSINFLLQNNPLPIYFSPGIIIGSVEAMAQASLVLELNLHYLSKIFSFSLPAR